MKPRNRPALRSLKRLVLTVIAVSWGAHVPPLLGQTLDERVQELSQRVEQLNAVILELRSEISESRSETRELLMELRVREQGEPVGSVLAVSQEPDQATGGAVPGFEQPGTFPAGDSALPAEDRLALLEEGQQLLADRLEEQYQTKVESASRYRTRFSGIVLLNAFGNRGSVDSQEVPNLALSEGPLGTRGTFGLSALQSQLGFETYGPTLAGGRASAGLQFDFFGEAPGTGYDASWGAVRLRTAAVRLDWTRTSLVVGQDAPFVSPLSPTSVASLGYPAFSHSGNLWTWIPQARIEHRLSASERNTVSLQGGFLGPVPRGARQPGYATRLAWSHGDADRPLALGIGAYYSRLNRGIGRTEDGWTGTADWMIPLGDRLDLSGEFYRGSLLGSLGAAQDRSVVFDGPESDPASSMVGLNVIGGWAQLTFRASGAVELHVAHGEDQPYSRDLRHFTPAPYDPISRNRSQMLNVVYRPRTDLLFSLEYRRLKTWRVSTNSDTADHFNLGVGVLF